MKNNHWNSTALLTSLICLGAASPSAEAADAAAKPALEKRQDSTDRFYMNGTVGLNISAKFSGFGSFLRQTANGAPTLAGDRVYDDGFNLVEGLGFPDTRTHKWGYANASQIDTVTVPGTTLIHFNSATAAPVLSGPNASGGAQPGFELGLLHRMGELGKGSWGFMAGFGYLNVSLEDNRTYVGSATQDTDTFLVSPAVVPPAGYDGTAIPVGPRIENVPFSPRVTTIIPGGITSTGPRSLNAHIFAAKAGPYWDLPLSERGSISLSGGLVLAGISSEFKYQEVNNIASAGPLFQNGASATQTFAGSNDKTELLPGGFVELRANYSLNEKWGIFAGGQFQYLGVFNQGVNGRAVRLDLEKSLSVNLGVSFNF